VMGSFEVPTGATTGDQSGSDFSPPQAQCEPHMAPINPPFVTLNAVEQEIPEHANGVQRIVAVMLSLHFVVRSVAHHKAPN